MRWTFFYLQARGVKRLRSWKAESLEASNFAELLMLRATQSACLNEHLNEAGLDGEYAFLATHGKALWRPKSVYLEAIVRRPYIERFKAVVSLTTKGCPRAPYLSIGV